MCAAYGFCIKIQQTEERYDVLLSAVHFKKKLVEFDNGNKYGFHWRGFRKKRDAGVGIFIKADKKV